MSAGVAIALQDVLKNVAGGITDNWIDLRLRYVVDARKRRLVRHELNEKILEAFGKEKDIRIASTTLEIVGMPKIEIEK